MKTWNSLLVFLWLFAQVAAAQVHGVVRDKKGDSLPGANVVWKGATEGTITDAEGRFSILKPNGRNLLMVSFMGYETDSVWVNDPNVSLDVILREGVVLEELQVVSRKMGTMKLRNSVLNQDMITSAELSRAACCNLGESFVTNPSVDVNYSDAATGAKQIRLLGLSGTYVQMLTENIPNYRGVAAPYGLNYVPGPWMQSIQVSKGSSSVKNGYEAIAGQINVEFKKPQTATDKVSVNMFASSSARYEANADVVVKLNDRWATMLLAHYENETKFHDSNKDGFADIPQVEQYNFWSRWVYMGDNYVFQAGIKAMTEERRGGQLSHDRSLSTTPYLIQMDTDRYEFFTKNAFILNKEKNTNIALMFSGTLHKQDAAYGRKFYNADQSNVYASLMFESEFNHSHSLSAGLSFNYDGFDQAYRLHHEPDVLPQNVFEKESVYGAYAQYTFNPNDRWVVMAGLRADYSSEYDFFVTPRAHIKYTPNEYLHFRGSIGKGYRTHHVLAENNYLLASSREIHIPDKLKQEEAWSYGASVSSYLPLWGKTLTLNADYYYTDFIKQVIIDVDTDAHAVTFANLDGRSYSQAFQLEASYPFFEGFSLTAAYRFTDVQTDYGDGARRKPLTGKYKSLFTASYQTPLGIWQFDATLQLNGGGRMPDPYEQPDGSLSWERNYHSFEQLSAQVTRYFRRGSIYVGGENLTGFKQKQPIIGASDPWGESFDSTMVWGPVHGVKVYVGMRANF